MDAPKCGLRCLLLLGVMLTSVAPTVQSQDASMFGAAPPGGRWTVTTRWDYRVRINGEYLGFANKELREVYVREGRTSLGWEVTGEARLLGATKKDGRPVAARLEGRDDVRFVLGSDGTVIDADGRYPSLRGFPSFPRGLVEPGDRWEAPLDVLVYGPDGETAVLGQIASYTYLGQRPYMGRDAHYFDVQWAIRYRGYDTALAGFLDRVEGSHQVSLVVDGETMAPVMARDSLSERWEWSDSRVEQRDGFALIFWDGVPPMDKRGIRREFEQRFPALADGGASSGNLARRSDSLPSGGGMIGAGPGDLLTNDTDSPLDESGGAGGDIVIEETSRGVSVTLRNLHFRPDLAEILPEDRHLLNQLAEILKSIPDRTVLVRGHTADVGRPSDEHALSEERARSVADELSAQGIDPKRLVYEGVGADEPVAGNDSEEGRRRNRRVELLILED